MNLDIRIPIGILFITLGVLLAAFGVLSDKTIYARSLDVNVNLWWGLVMLVFGGIMAFFGWRKAPAPTGAAPAPDANRGHH
jgi:protein-S-isoprenylcysteine O-methyltransferase Ste14